MSRFETSSLFQLTAMRFRLFLREPEAIFWIFIFPILLAVGLGIAFRNRPADVLQVGATTTQLTQALAADKGLTAATMDEAAGTHALATGNILLLAIQRPDGVAYKFDDTNPDARTARLLADRAIQTAAGRQEAVRAENQLVHETGARYIDFVVPGLLGMNLMGSAMWGLGFAIVDARQKKLLKRMVASPMPRWQYLASFLLSRLVLLVIEVGGLSGICAAGLRRAVSRLAVAVGISVRAHFAGVFRAGTAGRFAGQDHGGRIGADEPGHAAHVDSLRHLLFGDALSGGDSAAGAGASADRGHRRAARQHAARDEPGPVGRADWDLGGVAGGAVCRFAADLPLEMMPSLFAFSRPRLRTRKPRASQELRWLQVVQSCGGSHSSLSSGASSSPSRVWVREGTAVIGMMSSLRSTF